MTVRIEELRIGLIIKPLDDLNPEEMKAARTKASAPQHINDWITAMVNKHVAGNERVMVALSHRTIGK